MPDVVECCSCWVLESEDGRERYFGSLYPKLAESDPRVERVTIAFWEVADR